MDLLETIKTRRSIRQFISKSVSAEDMINILDAARLAPSGGNRQKWKFIYINDPQVLRMIKNCSPGFYGDAPAVIVAGLEDEDNEPYNIIGILDIGFAAENILLTAHDLGLGGCAIASFIAKSLKKVLNAPESFTPILILSIGYTDKKPLTPSKKNLSDIVYINEYGKCWDRLEESA